MSKLKILIQLDSDSHPSVFDAIVATDVRPLADVEREYIKWFVPCGNRSQAAEKFGIGDARLYREIKKAMGGRPEPH